nr:complex III assembly factor LYRM7-like isoform X2 [Penaeus vannamei]
MTSYYISKELIPIQSRHDEQRIEKTAARQRINEEFAKNRNISDAEDVKKLVDFGHQVEEVLCKSVVQAVQKDDGVYTAKIRDETTRLDNKPYTEMPESLIGPFKKKRTKCSDQEK